jgi:type III restriction enzyme
VITPETLLPPDEGLLDNVAAQLELREPNRDAILRLSTLMNHWYEIGREGSFEGVIDVATGVGKTYIIAGAIDYYAAQGLRNFAVIAPGSTILNKTIAQFNQGPKSLLPMMATRPKVITSENFTTSEVAAALEDDSIVKLFVFTVQAITKPDSTLVGRRTHSFQEGLGGEFYAHLDALPDLLVFADEHHTYYGPAFSKAIRDLTPLGLIGLTGTPHPKTPPEQIIYRYPLTAAIANEFVKTPVIVGRKDDRTDDHVQLRDGATLLAAKERALKIQCEARGIDPIHPIMLVNCESIEHAKETVAFLQSDQYMDGAYSGDGVVLEIHSKSEQDALAALEEVEDPASPCRIIVQVSMLKEGWDVKNIYVIASLRASVSDILTEQTLGRGLRLPFGSYTDMPLINELDVLAHEQYSALLKRTNTLKESFIDKRTVLETWTDSHGQQQVEARTVEVGLDVADAGADPSTTGPESPGEEVTGSPGTVTLDNSEDRLKKAQEAAETALMKISDAAPRVDLPIVATSFQPQEFRLEMVTDMDPFLTMGLKLATEPDKYLKRTKLSATITDSDGRQFAEIETEQAREKVEALQVVDDIEAAKAGVVRLVMASKSVPARKGQGKQVRRLLDQCLTGAGDKSETLLGAMPNALAQSIVAEIEKVRDDLPPSTTTTQVIDIEQWAPIRYRREPSSGDRLGGDFVKGLAYTGWHKGMFGQAWFDSSPERDAANVLDDDDSVVAWARLHRNDVPILWRGGDSKYNPDLLAIEQGGHYWLIEVKADGEMTSEEVQAKKTAAMQWANYVNASSLVNGQWGYLLASETNIKSANGSWKRLRAMAA